MRVGELNEVRKKFRPATTQLIGQLFRIRAAAGRRLRIEKGRSGGNI